MGKSLSSFQIVLLAIFGALGVGAVLIFALATAGNSGSSVGAVSVWGTFDATAVKTVIQQASDQDQRLLQVSYTQKDTVNFDTTLSNALSSGAGPDIFLMRSDQALFDAPKVRAIPPDQLTQTQFQATFVDAANSFVTQNGTVGVPILINPLVLYWNRDMLASAGVAQPPQYWDQVPGMAAQITQKNDAGAIQRSAIALGTYKNIDHAKDILAMMIMQAGGHITAVNSNGQVQAALTEGGSSSQAAQNALRFYTEFANPAQSDYTWNDSLPNARQAFAAGQLAMYIGYASEEKLIRATNPNLNYAVAPVPQIRGAANAIDGGAAYALAIPKTAKNGRGALTVAYLIASAQVDTAFAQALGLAPARRDALATTTSQGYQDLYYKQSLIVRSWRDPDPSQTGPIFQGMIEDTESGALQIADAVGRANQQLQHILDQEQSQTP